MESAIESAEEGKKEKVVKTSKKISWKWLKYFAMKWRFRVDQARALFGLLTFAALLAIAYMPSIPWFNEQGFWRGEFLLAVIVLVVFLLGGYLYDRFLKLWTRDNSCKCRKESLYLCTRTKGKNCLTWLVGIQLQSVITNS